MTDDNHNFGRRRLLQSVAASWMLSVSRVGFAASSQVVAVRVWPASSYTRLTLESSTPLKYKHFTLTNPHRLVIDIEGVHLNSVLNGVGKQIPQNDPFIKQARVGQFDKTTGRRVMELKKQINPHVFTLKPVAGIHNRLVVDL